MKSAFALFGFCFVTLTSYSQSYDSTYLTKTGLTETLFQETGLSQAKTLWVPAEYSNNKKIGGTLYINDNEFSLPGNLSDVAGFIYSNDNKLIVAVLIPPGATIQSSSNTNTGSQMFTESELRNMAPEMRVKALELMSAQGKTNTSSTISIQTKSYQIAFVKVLPGGQVERILGSVPDATQIVASQFGIYAKSHIGNRPHGYDGRYEFYSYSGFDLNGGVVNGPQNVLFATPDEGGGWYIFSPKDDYKVQMLSEAKGQSPTVINTDGVCDPRCCGTNFYNTVAAYLNMGTITDSARTTGYFMKGLWETGACGNQGYIYPATFKTKWKSEFGGRTTPNNVGAFARTSTLYKKDGATYFIGQMSSKIFKDEGTNVLMIELNNEKNWAPIFNVSTTGINIFRALAAGKSGLNDASANDYYSIISSDNIFLVSGRKTNSATNGVYGIYPFRKLIVRGDGLNNFLRNHSFVN